MEHITDERDEALAFKHDEEAKLNRGVNIFVCASIITKHFWSHPLVSSYYVHVVC